MTASNARFTAKAFAAAPVCRKETQRETREMPMATKTLKAGVWRSRGWAPIIAGLAVSVAFCVSYIARDRHILCHNDAYYYVAVADNLVIEGRLGDRTLDPAGPVTTPQNGVPMVYAALRLLGLSYTNCFLAVTLVNYVAWLSALYPFLGLVRAAGIRGYWARAALAVGFLASGLFLYKQLHPLNDGIYNAGSIWWVFLVYRTMVQGIEGDSPQRHRWTQAAIWTALALLLAVLLHFRINVLVYAGAATLMPLFAAASVRRRVVTSACIAGMVALASGSQYVVDLLAYHGTIATCVRASLGGVGPNALSKLGLVLFIVSGGREVGLLRPANQGARAGILGYSVVRALLAVYALALVGFLIFCIIHAWRKKRVLPALASLVMLGMMAFALLVVGMRPSVASVPRYIANSVFFLWLLAMMYKWTRPFVYLSVVLFVAQALFYISPLYLDMCKPGEGPFVAELAASGLRVPADAVLVSQMKRHSYVFLGGRHAPDLAKALQRDTSKVWILGDKGFRDAHLAELNGCEGWEVLSQHLLLQGKANIRGHMLLMGLLEVTLGPSAPPRVGPARIDGPHAAGGHQGAMGPQTVEQRDGLPATPEDR